MTSGSLVECNGDLACAGDNQGHGTHCAGTAAGTQYGVAPGATIRSVKVLSDQGIEEQPPEFQALIFFVCDLLAMPVIMIFMIYEKW